MIRTSTADHKGYEVPCSLFDELEQVEDSCQTEQHDENDRSDLGWVVPVQNVGIGVIERRSRLVLSHVACCRRRRL